MRFEFIYKTKKKVLAIILRCVLRHKHSCFPLSPAVFSPRGHLQAKEAGVCLAGESIDTIFVSPFTRTVETAAGIVSTWKGARPRICVEPGFGESLNACQDPPGCLSLQEIR